MKYTKKLTLCGTECRLQEYLNPVYKKTAGKAKREPVSPFMVRLANADVETVKKLDCIALYMVDVDTACDFRQWVVIWLPQALMHIYANRFPFRFVCICRDAYKLPKSVEQYVIENEKKLADKAYSAKKRKAKFKDIVACNPDLQRFMTLTFSENLKDVAVANAYFNLFMTKLRALAGKSFKYVCVIEFQERGAVHYHLLHNAKYIRASFLADLWGKGYVQNKSIDTRKNNNACAYLSSYMTKASEHEKLGAGKKAFHCSQNCVRPVVIENVDFHGARLMSDILFKLSISQDPSYCYEYEINSAWRDNYVNVVVYPMNFAFFASLLKYVEWQGDLQERPADIVL